MIGTRAHISNLYRMVSEAKGTSPEKGVPPKSTLRQLRKAGGATVKMKKIEANEAARALMKQQAPADDR